MIAYPKIPQQNNRNLCKDNHNQPQFYGPQLRKDRAASRKEDCNFRWHASKRIKMNLKCLRWTSNRSDQFYKKLLNLHRQRRKAFLWWNSHRWCLLAWLWCLKIRRMAVQIPLNKDYLIKCYSTKFSHLMVSNKSIVNHRILRLT